MISSPKPKLKPVAERAYVVRPGRCRITGEPGFNLWNQFEYYVEDWFPTRPEANAARDESNAAE